MRKPWLLLLAGDAGDHCLLVCGYPSRKPWRLLQAEEGMRIIIKNEVKVLAHESVIEDRLR
jgi:hypothetical protein